jgi:hypothetical protein
VLDVDTYDKAENVAAERYPNRILQAFYPEMFATLGYPARVKRNDQLWRYIDVMHETRTHFNLEYLLHGMTPEEFELFKKVTKIVDSHTTAQFGMRAHPTAALLRAIHVLRLIKIVTGSARPTVLEIGPGCGYLAVLLVMEGYPYVGTDVVQAFYLYQNHMLSLVAKNLRELVTEDADIMTVGQPEPGTAIHIPWWKWVTLTPDKIKLSAGIMTSNHVLCEMHPSSMAYLTVVAGRILANHPGGGKVVFDNWGYDLLHSHETVAREFAKRGLHVCHDEDAMTAMVLDENARQQLVQASPSPDPWLSVRRQVAEWLGYVPPLKRTAIRMVNFWQQRRPRPAPVFTTSNAPHPLSRQLTSGRKEVIAAATIQEAEVHAFLASHFGDRPPQHSDEAFLDLIGTRY